MNNNMKEKTSKSLQYYMRVLHRNLGYLAIGMAIVYSLSGIVLVHRGADAMKTSTRVEKTIAPNLTANEVKEALKMRKFSVKEETDAVVRFTGGEYDKRSGRVEYVQREYVFPMNKFVALHKMPGSQNLHVGLFATLFGIVLFFLAVSSLFMFKPDSKQFRKNMVYTAVGVVLTIILLATL